MTDRRDRSGAPFHFTYELNKARIVAQLIGGVAARNEQRVEVAGVGVVDALGRDDPLSSVFANELKAVGGPDKLDIVPRRAQPLERNPKLGFFESVGQNARDSHVRIGKPEPGCVYCAGSS